MVIVGAGPPGLLVGDRLADEGLEVDIVDMGDKFDTPPGATHSATPAAQETMNEGQSDRRPSAGISRPAVSAGGNSTEQG